MQSVLHSFVAWLMLLAVATAARIKAQLQRTPGGYDCPEFKELECKHATKWIMEQRKEYRCKPMQPSWLDCQGGMVPARSAWMTWKGPGERAAGSEPDACVSTPDQHGWYELERCKWQNYPTPGQKTKGNAIDGTCIVNPALGIRDCNQIRDELVQHPSEGIYSGQESLEHANSLCAQLIDMERRGPTEWMWLPPIRIAMWTVSTMVINYFASLPDPDPEWNSHAKQAEMIFRTFLLYCRGAKVRAVAMSDAAERAHNNASVLSNEAANQQGHDECVAETQLDVIFAMHPWRQELQTDASSLTSLEMFDFMSLTTLPKDFWDTFCKVALPDTPADAPHLGRQEMIASYQRIQQKFQDLIRTAGDRGEDELELALAYSSTKAYVLADGVEPRGGRPRLEMMRAMRRLTNLLSRSPPSNLQSVNDTWVETVRLIGQPGVAQYFDITALQNLWLRAVAVLGGAEEAEPSTSTTTTTTTTTSTTTTSTTTTVGDLDEEWDLRFEEIDASPRPAMSDAPIHVWSVPTSDTIHQSKKSKRTATTTTTITTTTSTTTTTTSSTTTSTTTAGDDVSAEDFDWPKLGDD